MIKMDALQDKKDNSNQIIYFAYSTWPNVLTYRAQEPRTTSDTKATPNRHKSIKKYGYSAVSIGMDTCLSVMEKSQQI
jgi:hypothetical protein